MSRGYDAITGGDSPSRHCTGRSRRAGLASRAAFVECRHASWQPVQSPEGAHR
jgi:hypothetical protein